MPFKKGENGMGGRPKGIKNKQRLIRYSPKKWETGNSKQILDQAKIDYYIYNDLPLDEYYDSLKLKDGNDEEV
jgi:hypothetical protein